MTIGLFIFFVGLLTFISPIIFIIKQIPDSDDRSEDEMTIWAATAFSVEQKLMIRNMLLGGIFLMVVGWYI